MDRMILNIIFIRVLNIHVSIPLFHLYLHNIQHTLYKQFQICHHYILLLYNNFSYHSVQYMGRILHHKQLIHVQYIKSIYFFLHRICYTFHYIQDILQIYHHLLDKLSLVYHNDYYLHEQHILHHNQLYQSLNTHQSGLNLDHLCYMLQHTKYILHHQLHQIYHYIIHLHNNLSFHNYLSR